MATSLAAANYAHPGKALGIAHPGPQLSAIPMLNGDIRSKIYALWNAFWIGGISNPLEVIKQITYLLFLKRLDDLHTLEESKAARPKLKKLERRVFPEGKDPKKRAYKDCRWSKSKNFETKEIFEVVNDHVFPFLRTLGGDDSTYAHHMKDALFATLQHRAFCGEL